MNNFWLKSILLVSFFFNLTSVAGAEKQIGAPRVKIRVAQYQSSLSFVLPKGGRWLSNNRSGNIPAQAKCQIVGKLKTPAKKKFHLMAGSAKATDEKKLKEVKQNLESQGFSTHEFMVGKAAEKGFPDNRIVFVGVGLYFDENEAQQQLDKLAAKNISSWIFAETIEPAKGTMILKVGNKTVPFNFTDISIEGRSGVKLLKAEYAKGYSWHGFADRTYKSRIQIRWGSDDCLDCIEHTDLESLLVGIVPSEISAKAAPAALQAQATAARGEMLSKLGTRHYNEGYDFCSEQHCQVYKGMQSCDDHIYSSIRNTWGIILENHEGGAVDAVYSANCGGHSSANQNIWTSNADPHLQGVPDTIDGSSFDLTDENQVKEFIRNPPKCWCGIGGVEGSDKFRWKKEISGKNWKKVEEAVELGRIKSVNSFVRDISGRIISLKITGENGEKTIMKELTIRRLFNGLRSSCFIVDWNYDKQGFIVAADFEGAGWGHGVGMCQTGAQSMAANGKKFNEILLHYFPGAKLKSLY
jgi:SpoIID/LytB domain protein